MKKLIIFDCDGVLVDSEIIAQRVGVEVLSEIGYSISVEESIKKFTGLNGAAERKIVYEESGITVSDDFFDQVRLPRTLDAFEQELEPLIMPVLEFVRERGFDRCVASSSERRRVKRSLSLTNQIQFFEEVNIFTAQLVKKPKPAPDLFLLAAKRMGYAPKDCLVIEDSISGVKAGLAANMSVIAFLGGTHAQYGWYQERMKAMNTPIAYNAAKLQNLIVSLISAVA